MKPNYISVHNATKTVLSVVVVAVSVNLSAKGQGNLGFSNKIKGVVVAPVYDTDCRTPLAGTNFLSEFYAGLTPDTLRPSGDIEPFTLAGYVYQGSGMEWDGYNDGTLFYVQMRAWEASAGASFEAAVANGGKFGFSNLVREPLRLAPASPEEPVGLASFCLLPPLGQQPRLTMTVATAPQLLLLETVGVKGWNITLQASTNLVSWISVTTNVLSDAVWIYQDNSQPADRRFYRALLQQKP